MLPNFVTNIRGHHHHHTNVPVNLFQWMLTAIEWPKYPHLLYQMGLEWLSPGPETRTARQYRWFSHFATIYCHRLLLVALQLYDLPSLPAVVKRVVERLNTTSLMMRFWLHNRSALDPVFPVIMYLLWMFSVIAAHWLHRIRSRLEDRAWRWWRHLLTTSQDHYREALVLHSVVTQSGRNSSKSSTTTTTIYDWGKPSERAPQLYRLSHRALCHLFALQPFDLKHFERQPVPGLSELSTRLRLISLGFVLSVDRFSLLGQLFIAILCLGTAVVYLTDFLCTDLAGFVLTEPVQTTLTLFEFGLIFYGLLRLARVALLFSACSLLGTLVYVGHVNELARQVVGNLRERVGGSSKTISVRFLLDLRRLCAQHTLVSALVTQGSDQLFGPVMAAFLLTNLPVNLYLVQRNIRPVSTVTTYALLLGWIVVLVQTCGCALVFGPLVVTCGAMHRPARILPGLQVRLLMQLSTCNTTTRGRSFSTDGFTGLRLQCDQLYGRLVYGRPVSVSMTPGQPITSRSVVEFVLAYVAYHMMAHQVITRYYASLIRFDS